MWYGPDLRCEAIQCGPAQTIAHSSQEATCSHYRCELTYHCQPGFSMIGERTILCQSDGTWSQSQLPTCIPAQCRIPESPLNGKAVYTTVSYKSVVSFQCSYGFMLAGNGTRTCQADQQWSGRQPHCVEINCPFPNGGILPNGWFEGSRSGLNAVIRFRCEPGMTFSGEADQATCGADGQWSVAVAQCLAPCTLDQVEHGQTDTRLGDNIPHGQVLAINCSQHYELQGEAEGEGVRCNNGTWSQQTRCFPASCKTMPDPPSNGMVVVPGTSHGSTALYQCKDGYSLQGDNTTSCIYGDWTGGTPYCQETYCDFPGYLTHGKILLVGNMGLYDYRPYVKKITNDRQILFDCDKGFKLEMGAPQGATCIDGKWSPLEIPMCLPEYHPRLRWLDKRSITASQLQEFNLSLANSKNSSSAPAGRRKRSVEDGSCPDLDTKLLTIEKVTNRHPSGSWLQAL